MTDDEARQKRCPLAFAVTLYGIIAQPQEIQQFFADASKCSGSDCSVWDDDFKKCGLKK